MLAPRPGVEIVDVIELVAAVAAEARTRAGGAHLLKLAGGEAQIKGGLLGVEEGTPLPGPLRAGNFIIHEVLAASKAAPTGRPCSQRVPRFGGEAEARKKETNAAARSSTCSARLPRRQGSWKRGDSSAVAGCPRKTRKPA